MEGKIQQVRRSIRLRDRWIAIPVALLALVWLALTPAGLLGKADAVAYAVCHRIDLRSFHLGERAIPLCARCTGMYLGAILGLLYLAVRYPRRSGMPPRKALLVFGLLAAAFIIDGANSTMSLIPGLPLLYQPDNFLRLATGMGMGLGLAAILYPSFNQTVWKSYDPRPVLPDLKSLSLLLILGAAVVHSVIIQNVLILYVYALISAAGVLVMLTIVATLIGLMLLRLENRFESWLELALPLTAGFGMTILWIGLADLARYLLTHTWGGFEFG